MAKKVEGKLYESLTGQLFEIGRQLRQKNGYPFNPAMLQKHLQDAIVGKFSPAKNSQSEVFTEWKKFYQKLFNRDFDFSNIAIPEKSEGNWRLLIIADIPLEALYAKCKEQFPCWRWTDDDLGKIVNWNERDAKNGAYAIWVRDDVEADESLKNLSAESIKTRSIATETLAERLIHELKFFDETGNHLDIQNVTLCAGSRYSDGGVPGVRWYGGKLRVYWYVPDSAGGSLRARLVVS